MGNNTSIDSIETNIDQLNEIKETGSDHYENNIKIWRTYELFEEVISEGLVVENFLRFDPEESYTVLHIERQQININDDDDDNTDEETNSKEKRSLRDFINSITDELTPKDLESSFIYFFI
jgi:hypothetical protein